MNKISLMSFVQRDEKMPGMIFMIKAIPPPLFSARTKPKQPPPGLPRIYDNDKF